METSWLAELANQLSSSVSDATAPKWAGGGGVAALAYITFQFWNTWRKGKIEVLQIEINRAQKREENEMSEFQAVLAAKDEFIKNLQDSLKTVYAENDTLRRIFNADRDQWGKEKVRLHERNNALIQSNSGLLADKLALNQQNNELSHQVEQLKAEKEQLRQEVEQLKQQLEQAKEE